MTDKVIENNQAAVMGKIISGFTFSHEIFGEGFYMMDVEIAYRSVFGSSWTVPFV